jgi:HD superfamily phosphohydrolase
LTDISNAKRSTLDRPGVERFIEIAAVLDHEDGLWTGVEDALQRVGLSTEYVAGFQLKADKNRLKFIKDSVWGMMEFSRDEMALIDSPLLQRLRGIKQNGFTYFTYPSAEHSRFSHTLGVAHVAKRLLRSVNELARRQPTFIAGGQEFALFSILDRPDLARNLIHAALLHDTGHFAFSHASEMALKTNADRLSFGTVPITKIINLFRKYRIDSELSEVLSIVLCLSPRFRRFYAKIDPDQDDKAIYRVCCFICGVSHDHGFPGLANIISGAVVDADKIDYINRDALHCGIPAGIDVSRIFLNTSLVKIDEHQAAKIGAKTRQSVHGSPLAPGVHFIVNSAGIDTYDEIATSKSILYHRVYLHPATRNAEQLFSECISRICSRGVKAGAPLINILKYYPLKDQQMLDAFDIEADTAPIAKRLAERRLPKRAFIVFRDVCEPFVRLSDLFGPVRGGDGYDRGLIDQDTALFRSSAWRIWSGLAPDDPIEAPKQYASITKQIREFAVELREMLDSTFTKNGLARAEPYVGFAPRVMLKPAPEVLVREKNSIGRSASWTKSEELTTAENIFKATDYVFADVEWLPFVRAATVRAIFEFGKTLAPHKIDDVTEPVFDLEPAQFEVDPTLDFLLEDIASRLGLDYDEIVNEMKRAADAGFFGDAFRLAPLDRTQEQHCHKVLSKYANFSGERGWRLSHRSVTNFIRQFPIQLRDQAIELVLSGDILKRNDFATGILKSLKPWIDKRQPLIISRFSPNSGNLAGMLLEQDARDALMSQGHEFCRNLSDVERSLEVNANRSVVFVDDQFSAGGQARAQLHCWANVDRNDWPIDLRRESNIDLTPPSPRFMQHLRTGEVLLSFLYGTKAGKLSIETTARALGFERLSVVYDEELPSKAPIMSSEMKRFLEDVGMHVLQHCSAENPPLETFRADALGYGGAASLMVTPFNVPSHTITAIWCPGKYRSLPWVPLLIRRGYRKHLVIG